MIILQSLHQGHVGGCASAAIAKSMLLATELLRRARLFGRINDPNGLQGIICKPLVPSMIFGRGRWSDIKKKRIEDVDCNTTFVQSNLRSKSDLCPKHLVKTTSTDHIFSGFPPSASLPSRSTEVQVRKRRTYS